MYLGYVRVSTGKQTVENQMYAIEDFCAHQNPPIHIDDWIIETASGMKHFDKCHKRRHHHLHRDHPSGSEPPHDLQHHGLLPGQGVWDLDD